jgi:hypothetical protein
LSRRLVCTFVRGVLEDRLERQAPLIVRGLRSRLESGNPPDDPVQGRGEVH